MLKCGVEGRTSQTGWQIAERHCGDERSMASETSQIRQNVPLTCSSRHTKTPQIRIEYLSSAQKRTFDVAISNSKKKTFGVCFLRHKIWHKYLFNLNLPPRQLFVLIESSQISSKLKFALFGWQSHNSMRLVYSILLGIIMRLQMFLKGPNPASFCLYSSFSEHNKKYSRYKILF